jgi:apolipoprotein N-acyltransferase
MKPRRLLEGPGVAPAVFSALLWALAFPPFELGLLVFVCLVPLLMSLRSSRRREAFRNGWVMGAVFALVNFFWVAQFVSKWTGSLWLGVIPLIVMAAAFGVYTGLFAVAAAWSLSRRLWWLIPLLWAGLEVFRSNVPYLFFPWSLFGTALYKLPVLLQPAYWGGTYFLGAWIALVNTLVFLFLTARDEDTPVRNVRAVGWAAVVAAAVPILAVYSYLQPIAGRTIRVAAVQTGVDMAFAPDGRPTTRQQVWSRLSSAVPPLLQSCRTAAIAVLPEGIAEGVGDLPPALPFAYDGSPPIVTGGVREVGNRAYQALYGYDGAWKHADKTRLVIFGEYVPFRDILPFLDAFNLPSGDLTPGEQVQTILMNGVRVGGLLCFEGTFEEVAREQARQGAEVLALLTIDDWYQGTGAIPYLISSATLRAAENRLPLVRSSPLGPSLVIDSRGRRLAQVPQGRAGVAAADVTLEPSSVSPLRQAFPVGAVFTFFGALLLALAGDFRKNS